MPSKTAAKKTDKHCIDNSSKRRSGILLHPTSLPCRYGIGDLGKSAYRFADFLFESRQTLWQVLPLGHTGFGDSPYQTFCAFAGNPLLISPDVLCEEGFLAESDLSAAPEFDPLHIDYGEVLSYKTHLLKKAFEGFKANAYPAQSEAFCEFCKENEDWLEDYSLFMAVKNYYIAERKETFETKEYHAFKALCGNNYTTNEIDDNFYGGTWQSWDDGLKNRNAESLKEWKEKLETEVEYYSFLQYEFYREWAKLKNYANSLGIKIIGDIPIFVAKDSSDTWASRELFLLDKSGNPKLVAGVPPDYFSNTGQLWGNPLYDWVGHKNSGFEWWIRRISHMLESFDILRIDHFRGFDECWAIPFGEKTAEKGKWLNCPGNELWNAVIQKHGKVPIIAEDLGILTSSVEELRDTLGFPGMKVLQFAFSDGAESAYLPHNFTGTNSVVYTGTHDNDTTASWYENASDYEKDHLRKYMCVDGSDVAWNLIRLALSSTAVYAVFPLQDVLSLKSDARMNTPGTREDNWQFRFTEDMLKTRYAEGLAYLSELFGRNEDSFVLAARSPHLLF